MAEAKKEEKKDKQNISQKIQEKTKEELSNPFRKRRRSNLWAFFTILSIFALLCGFMSYYVLYSYYSLFGLDKNDIFYILLIVSTFSFIMAGMLESVFTNKFTRAIYILSAVWMGFMFINMLLITCYMMLLFIFRMSFGVFYMAGFALLAISIVAAIYAYINAVHIKVREINLYNDKNVEARIIQISDLHLGPVHGKNYLEGVIDRVNKLNPDLVLMTGDLLDGKLHYPKDMLSPLNDLKSDIYFVHGNHDTYAGLDKLHELMDNTKVRWLRNERIGYGNFEIIGVDDNSDANTLGGFLYAMNMHKKIGEKFTVLMTHRPIGWKYAAGYVDLMIAGHTHAGQLWPFNYLAKLENGASKGIYRVANNSRFMLYVNPGTGTWGPPMRIGSQSEITVFNIKRGNYK